MGYYWDNTKPAQIFAIENSYQIELRQIGVVSNILKYDNRNSFCLNSYNEIIGLSAKTGEIDHPKPVETDHLKPVQIDHPKPVQIDHLI